MFSQSSSFRVSVTGKTLSTAFVEACQSNQLFAQSHIEPSGLRPLELTKEVKLSDNKNLSFNLTPYIHDDLQNIASHGVLRSLHLLIIAVDISTAYSKNLEETLALDFIINRAKAQMTHVVIAGVLPKASQQTENSETIRQLTQLANKYSLSYYSVDLNNSDDLTQLLRQEITKHGHHLPEQNNSKTSDRTLEASI
ncbi:MAG: hypothetical protein AB7F64_00310 [Gammaproteobacteria bacterium]